MRKKILGIITILSIISIVGCGEQATTMGSNVESKDESIESSESTPTPTSSPEVDDKEDGIVSSGSLDEIPDANEEGNEKFSLGDYDTNGIRTVYTMLFPDDVKAEAWLQEHHFENPDYSYYITYFKNGDGDEMSFTWVGSVGIGEWWWLSEDERFFYVESDNNQLIMWNYGTMSGEDELMKNYTASELMGFASGTPIENSFQVDDTNEFYRVTFMTNEVIDGKNYVGYHCYVDYYDIMECWQFKYLVEEAFFNEAEALATVNSIVRVNLDDLGIIVEE